MKLQLDTTMKTIKVEGMVNLKELMETLERLLPGGLWKEFSLESNTTIIWTNPTVIYPRYPVWPYYPWWTPTYQLGDTWISDGSMGLQSEGKTYTLAEGVYNVEV